MSYSIVTEANLIINRVLTSINLFNLFFISFINAFAFA
jgi:hypothetical protein